MVGKSVSDWVGEAWWKRGKTREGKEGRVPMLTSLVTKLSKISHLHK